MLPPPLIHSTRNYSKLDSISLKLRNPGSINQSNKQFLGDLIRYDTIEEINVDSKAEYTA